MALSNWDMMQFDSDANPVSGVVVLNDEIGLDIYKNWLNVTDPKSDEGYYKSQIAHIEHGDIALRGTKILATRHPLQNSIFVYAYNRVWEKDEKGNSQLTKIYRFAGIGCYGYKSMAQWVKENMPHLLEPVPEKFLDESNARLWVGSGSDWNEEENCSQEHLSFYIEHEDKKNNEGFEDHFELELPTDVNWREVDTWEGVNKETFEAFKKWLEEVTDYDEDKEWTDKITLDNALRVNQGDQFFAANLGMDIGATKVGEQQPTVLSEIIKSMGDDSSKE